MLKFLFYTFLFYFIFRFVFGRLFGAAVKTKVYKYETHHHHYNQPPREKEGKVTIDTRNAKPSRDSKNIGEYIDYEEVK